MRLKLTVLLTFLLALIAAGPVGAATASAPPPDGLQIDVPANARLNGRGDGWLCNYGHRRTGKTCSPIVVPRNATLGPYGDVWVCLPGYFTYRGICLPEEGADREMLEAPPRPLKPWQILVKMPEAAASPPSRNDAFYRIAPLIAAAMALGVWMFFFGERDPPTRSRNYAGTAIIVKRPQRAVTVNVWRSAGDKVDALTGALIPEAVDASQCRNCRVFYRRESLGVLRRQNGGSCISCGRAAFQAVGLG